MNIYHNIRYFISKFWEHFKLFFLKSSPRWFIFLIDFIVAAAVFWFVYFVRFNFSFQFDLNEALKQWFFYLIYNILLFGIFKPYVGVVRHTGWKDIGIILKVTSTLFLILLTQTFLARQGSIPAFLNVPLSIVFLAPFFQAFVMGSLRMLYKTFYYKISRSGRMPIYALIYGSNMEAVQVLSLLQTDPNLHYIIKGFVTTEDTIKKHIQGIPIVQLENISKELLEKWQIDQFIIIKTQENPLDILEISEKFAKHGIQIKTIPSPRVWMENMTTLPELQDFDLSALLERPPIKTSANERMESLRNKIIWVTGAAGSIGSELVKQIIWHQPRKIYLLDQAETPLYELENELKNIKNLPFESILTDITDRKHIDWLFKNHHPDIIFHAAAYKHVPIMELNPYYALQVNVLATKYLMEKALDSGVEKFVQISTDKAVNPTNIMGASKRLAELIARCLQEKSGKTAFIITRFGNVLGSNGSVIHLFKKQISRGGPVTVTHPDINRFFMTISEAAQLVLKASDIGKGGNIYVFDMGKPVRIADLAIKMIHLSGKKYPDDISIVYTGLRPGEKLSEEILTSEEKVEQQIHEKLFIAKLAPVNCKNFRIQIEKLEKYLHNWDLENAIKIVKQLLPEFKSNHSPFEKFD